jgi:hypothetical protein
VSGERKSCDTDAVKGFELAVGARQRFVRIAQLALARQHQDAGQEPPQQNRGGHRGRSREQFDDALAASSARARRSRRP